MLFPNASPERDRVKIAGHLRSNFAAPPAAARAYLELRAADGRPSRCTAPLFTEFAAGRSIPHVLPGTALEDALLAFSTP